MSDMETVFALLEKPQDEWSKAELTEALFTTLAIYQDAMTGWGEVLAHCDFYQSTNENLLLDNAVLLQTLADKTTGPTPGKKGVGRPEKHKDLKWLFDWQTEAREKYGNLPDTKLIIAYFTDEYKLRGMRAGRVDSTAFKSKAETLRKLMIEARKQVKRLSGN